MEELCFPHTQFRATDHMHPWVELKTRKSRLDHEVETSKSMITEFSDVCRGFPLINCYYTMIIDKEVFILRDLHCNSKVLQNSNEPVL